jgi:predicted kinase
MKKQTLFILCGEAFSGKSTLAKKLAEKYQAQIIGRDAIYFALEQNLALEETPEEDDESLWNALWPIVMQGAKNNLSIGNSVVIDDNCLFARQRNGLRAIADEKGIRSVLIYLDIRTETIRKRKEENKRSHERHDVPSEWLAEDAERFERPIEQEEAILFTADSDVDDLFIAIEARS